MRRPSSNSPPPINAGTINDTSATAPVYELSGASITGAGGHGLSSVTPDTNTADTLTVQMDQASSISVSGNTFNGLNLSTSGANIVVNTAGPISATGTGSFGINAGVQSGNGSVSIRASANVSGASQGIVASTPVGPVRSTSLWDPMQQLPVGFIRHYEPIHSAPVAFRYRQCPAIPSILVVLVSPRRIFPRQSHLAPRATIDVTASGTINSGPTLFSKR